MKRLPPIVVLSLLLLVLALPLPLAAWLVLPHASHPSQTTCVVGMTHNRGHQQVGKPQCFPTPCRVCIVRVPIAQPIRIGDACICPSS